MTQNKMNLCACQKEGTYKCPVCRSPYCSVDCYKVHKLSPCSPKKPTDEKEQNVKKEYNFPTADTVSLTKLEQLQYSENVKNCLQNPHVKNIMQTILSSSNPTDAVDLAMKEPIFVELADACLKVVEPQENEMQM